MRVRWVCTALAVCAFTIGSAGYVMAQSELTAPSLVTVRAPGSSGGTTLGMVASSGSGSTLSGTIGQLAIRGRQTGFTTLKSAQGGFWPIAAVFDCDDASDLDCDGLPNAIDRCPYFNSRSQADSDGDGIGDVCECSDQTGDGWVTVSDIVAINQAIFTPALVSPLCDGNGDRVCNVTDIVQANLRIFGGSSVCRRYPTPAP